MQVLSNETKQELKQPWMKHYFFHFFLSMALYLVLLFGSIILLRNNELGLLRIPIGLSPALPIAYLVWAYMNTLKLMDEFMRHIHIRSILFGSAITVAASVFIAFFENAGLPPLTFHVWVIMCVSWGIALMYNSRKYR